jgi:WhiB family redox-sensing transcriptional regulator
MRRWGGVVTAPNFLDGRQLCASPTVDKEDWFPGRGEDGIAATVRAKAVCARCPLREPCLAYALPYGALQGIWGNTTVSERAEMRKRRGTESQPLLPPGSVRVNYGPKPKPREEDPPCGTVQGYWAHHRRKETTCTTCRAALAAERVQHRAERKTAS